MILAAAFVLIVIPLIILPAAFIWYLNIGGIAAAVRNARAKKVAATKVES